MTTYYVCGAPQPGKFELRQQRYRMQLSSGREHPHDLMATNFNPEPLRELIAKWFPDTDTTLLD